MFRTFSVLIGDHSREDMLINLNHIVKIEPSRKYSGFSIVHMSDGTEFITTVAINRIRMELDPEFKIPE